MVEPVSSAPVLVVDDEPDFREGLQSLIAASGFEVHAAVNGRDALELLKTIPRPGLILLDLMMPVMNGHQLLKLLETDPAYAQIPVIVLSAAAVPIPGAVLSLKKPPDLDELLGQIRHYCGSGRP